MLAATADRVDDAVLTLVIGLVAVALAGSPRLRPRGPALAIGGSTVLGLLVVRARVPDALDAGADGPAWFTLAALAAGAVGALAVARLLDAGRGPEAVALLGAGVGAAAAALPDVEVLLAVAALWLPWLLAPTDGERHRGGTIAATVVGLAVALALVDGARGRPGTILLAPVVVGPAAVLAIALPRATRPEVLARVVVAGAVGVLVARHAGLTAGTARPLIGSLLGLVVLAAVAGLRRPRGRPG
ncbi:MAG TPA: hypothetical protein VFU19_03900 [Iamia sp.]|nr:hypothetical protein [Iamia sp.]